MVHHDNYHTVREAVGRAKLTSNTDDLDAVIQVSCRLNQLM